MALIQNRGGRGEGFGRAGDEKLWLKINENSELKNFVFTLFLLSKYNDKN